MEHWISATIGLAIGALMVLYLARRKPLAFDKVAPRNRVTIMAHGDPKHVLNAIVALTRTSKYMIGSRDDANGTVILQEPFSVIPYGSLFRVEVKPDGPDKSEIHVAVVGKRYQWGPAFQRSKRQFLAALQKAIEGKPAPA